MCIWNTVTFDCEIARSFILSNYSNISGSPYYTWLTLLHIYTYTWHIIQLTEEKHSRLCDFSVVVNAYFNRSRVKFSWIHHSWKFMLHGGGDRKHPLWLIEKYATFCTIIKLISWPSKSLNYRILKMKSDPIHGFKRANVSTSGGWSLTYSVGAFSCELHAGACM